MADTLFPLNDDDTLLSVYQKQGRTLDDLPYTEAFEAIYLSLYGTGGRNADDLPVSKAKLFRRLHNLRKAGRLPRLGRSGTLPPRIEASEETLLVSLVERSVGQLSKRDQLVYQPDFDRVVDDFNRRTGRSLTPHAIWRIVAKLAK